MCELRQLTELSIRNIRRNDASLVVFVHLRDTDLVKQFTKLIFIDNGSRSPTHRIRRNGWLHFLISNFLVFFHRAVGSFITIKVVPDTYLGIVTYDKVF